MNAREYLIDQICREARTNFGVKDRAYLESVADTWMDDTRDPHHRMETLASFLPGAERVLDMASGCGTCVFHGLRKGYDMYGVDPEQWKCSFIFRKASELGYPREWVSRFSRAVGEQLPFPDSSFDCVTTYQTLEHVQDVGKVIREIIRVIRPEGGIHIHCPDYRGTFEGHYRLPWLPLLPKSLARVYLGILGKPIKGLESIHYVTRRNIIRTLHRLTNEKPSLRIRVVDVDREAFSKVRRNHRTIGLTSTYIGYQTVRYLRNLFKGDIASNLFVYVLEK